MEQMVSPLMISVLIGAFFIFLFLFMKSLRKTSKLKLFEIMQLNENDLDVNKTIMGLNEKEKEAEDNLSFLQKKEKELERLNVGINLPTYLVISVLSSSIIFVIIYKVLGNPFFAAPFVFLGTIIPDKIVKFKVKRNMNKFNNQLIKALRRMASVMRAGGSIRQALSDVVKARSIPEAIRKEFHKVLIDIGYGESIEKALRNLYDRTGSEDVLNLSIAIEIQKSLGGNLAQTIDSISQNISNRIVAESDIRATLSQSKTTSTILSCFPFIAVAGIYFINPTYFEPFFTGILGRVIFLSCFALNIVGVFIINKMSDIEI